MYKFVQIYELFQRRKVIFYIFLVSCLSIMGYFALQVRFEENVTSFLPDTEDAATASKVFNNLQVKDKIIVMFTAADTARLPEQERFIEASTALDKKLTGKLSDTHIKDIFYRVDAGIITQMSDFVYNNLPVFLTDEDYLRFDSLITKESIGQVMQRNYSNLLSPAGVAMKDFIMRDPLSLGGNTLKNLQDFQLESDYEIADGYIFSKDGTTSFMFITPVFATGSTGENEILISTIEEAIAEINKENSEIQVEYFGGPSVAVYNARQIKEDTIITSTIALVIIVIFISLVFKRKRAIPLIITPALFGGIFALCLIYFIKGTISAIAVGSGSIVFGIALSYSIHMLAHQNHVNSVPQLIKEIAYPLTIGSFTTVGAFIGLLFTSSDLLRDFGLFASLVLIGTTFFCLIFLPHFLKGQAHVKQGKVLNIIERANAYSFEKNKWLVGALVVITIICLFTSQRVTFNEDMMVLNYEPKHLKDSEQKLSKIFSNDEKNVLFVTVGKDMNKAASNYARTNRRLSELKQTGEVIDYASVERFIVPPDEQQRRLEKWNNYWTPEKKDRIIKEISENAATYKFRQGSFDSFFDWLAKPFEPLHYSSNEAGENNRLLSEWQTSQDSLTMIITQVRLNENNRETIYNSFNGSDEVVIFDRSYFTNKWVSAVNDDFYLILFISSFLVFFALWISYGRIELTLMSFLPMVISWVIIIGIMGLLGIQFNIVNIILSTFIFGIGDDFSIFIMDGLQSKYRTGQKVLNSHKTAIFFSAFTMIVGIGVLIFAKHPALQSISLISILGMVAVVLVAFTIQPIIFNCFIANPASKGLPPYTFAGVVRSAFLYILFLFGCFILFIAILLLVIVPIKKKRKKQIISHMIHYLCRGLISLVTFVKKEKINTSGETFKKPGVIIANHQSMLDILIMLSLSPRIVMVTKKWVWNSPVYGIIIRYVDFYTVGDGYELSVEKFRKKIEEGYSIAIFPEGTRSGTVTMKRFHKGAFYLSEELNLDILPILFYGHNQVISKSQPFNVRKGLIVTKILPRIAYEDRTYGNTYQERTKSISGYMRKEYADLYSQKDNTDNPHYYENLVHNYIYKGPVQEWYMRIKIKMENNYRFFNELIPKEADITDIGCGYGPLCYMLSMLSDKRNILGIDYDEDKIAVANHAWLHNERTHFVCADAPEYDYPETDVFILSDMLHYLNYETQKILLKKCAEKLKPGGMIIIRDANVADAKRHRLTNFTEVMSTEIVKFNKTKEKLCFTSEDQIHAIAKDCNMQFEALGNAKYTSNTIYLFKKPLLNG